jgi:hypothetical protein
VQNTKDTFYETLRARLTALNPARTMVVRSLTRPGILVVENELITAGVQLDCFRLRWDETATEAHGAMPMVTLQCAIDYATAGTEVNGGMDRGRALAAMDAELQTMLNGLSQNATKNNYAALANGGPVVALSTKIWWGEATFGHIEVNQNKLSRTAKVSVMSYQEAGEL